MVERKYYIELSEQEYESLVRMFEEENESCDEKYLESILFRLKRALPQQVSLDKERIHQIETSVR